MDKRAQTHILIAMLLKRSALHVTPRHQGKYAAIAVSGERTATSRFVSRSCHPRNMGRACTMTGFKDSADFGDLSLRSFFSNERCLDSHRCYRPEGIKGLRTTSHSSLKTVN